MQIYLTDMANKILNEITTAKFKNTLKILYTMIKVVVIQGSTYANQ
jgi:hypothetical protein